MKIFVCIKQVPSTSKVEVDDNGVLKREGVSSKMNPYDLYALECGMMLKEQYNGELIVGTMGPNQAKSILEEAFMMGADEAYLFSDRRFAGADVLATSYTISQGIRAAGDFDIIICGKQTTDGDTAQVGPSIATYLDIPSIAWVKEIVGVEDHCVILKQGLDSYDALLRVQLPCLITIEKDSNTPRLPSYKLKKAMSNKQIHVLSLDNYLDQNTNHYGLSGSPTQVERIFNPTFDVSQEILKGNDIESARRAIDLLKEKKYI